jgi:twitching motility protein PilT
VNRVIDFFPPHQQKQIRLSLAGTLRGIICQRLVPTVDGGRTPALEILVNTGRVAERITDEEKTAEIKEVVAEGGYYGMLTFDQALLQLIQEGVVSVEDAMQAVSSKHDFELALQQAGMPLPSHERPEPPAEPDTTPAPDTAADPETTAPAGVADILGAPTGVEVAP